VLDETITGFRHHLAGAQAIYGVDPDLSIFGKALGNGFSVSALLGKREHMRLGGINHNQPRVFLMSMTNGAETHCLAAALAVISTYQQHDVIGALHASGSALIKGLAEITAELGIADHFGVNGRPSNLVYFTLDRAGKPSQRFRTLFMQEMVRRGILAPSFVVSYAHSPSDIERTIEAARAALTIYARALQESVDPFLEGPSVKPVFRKYC
jgi:glutamate-1-semialdehyde 2,1-aminomutase